jgi:hypothetical protein
MNIIQTPTGYRATIDETEWSIPNDPGNRFWQMVQQAIADGAPVTVEQPPAPTAEELLAAERAQMNPYAAPGFIHLLDRVEKTVTAARAVDPYADIVIWFDRVTQVLRLHPDMEAFRVQFGARETELDDLFRLALQIEGNV